MTNTSFDRQIDEFMVNCRSRQLRAKTLASYEQTLRLFERRCKEHMKIEDVRQVTESVSRRKDKDKAARSIRVSFSVLVVRPWVCCGDGAEPLRLRYESNYAILKTIYDGGAA